MLVDTADGSPEAGDALRGSSACRNRLDRQASRRPCTRSSGAAGAPRRSILVLRLVLHRWIRFVIGGMRGRRRRGLPTRKGSLPGLHRADDQGRTGSSEGCGRAPCSTRSREGRTELFSNPVNPEIEPDELSAIRRRLRVRFRGVSMRFNVLREHPLADGNTLGRRDLRGPRRRSVSVHVVSVS